MIDQIQVKNVALIEHAEVQLSPGLTVITGETGSGKTALLSSLKLLVGERSDKDMVRDGQSKAEVSGRFFLNGDEAEDGLVVSRSLTRDGKSRVSVDGSLSTVKALSQSVGESVDLCGQHEHQRLLKVAEQRKFLDAWIGRDASDAVTSYSGAYEDVVAAKREVKRLEDLAASDAAQLENARYVLRRIGEVNPKEGEYEELLMESARMENSEAFARCAAAVDESLSSDEGVLSKLPQAIRALEEMSAVDPSLVHNVESLREALYGIEDVAREVSRYQDDFCFDESCFEEMQSRISAFQGLMRMYGPTMDDVFKERTKAQEIIDMATGANDCILKAREALEQSKRELKAKGDALVGIRKKAAPAFSKRVCQMMSKLEMGESSLACMVTPLEFDDWSKESPCRVEFLFQPAKDMALRPLSKIASGGELSRVMLAVKVVLGSSDSVETLVFDEIDAGVGGKTALAIAEILEKLSETHQVLVVTHLAQIAVAGQSHLVVSKDGGITSIDEVSGESRVLEVARMLSGDTSDASVAHARKMLEAFAA